MESMLSSLWNFYDAEYWSQYIVKPEAEHR
ncbi:hypothetical protein PAEAM_00870 [Paenibacillus sp. GM1FR]|nr:hypothetical protein PAEAM_00870 [Paenibacillus sp. GM1FR]